MAPKRKITSQSSTTSTKKKKTLFYSNFVKTSFENRHNTRNSSSMHDDIQEIIQDLVDKPVNKWGKIRIGKFMSILTTTHSIVADEGLFTLAYEKFNVWTFNRFEMFLSLVISSSSTTSSSSSDHHDDRPEIIDIMDPHYVFINWGVMAPQPIDGWNLPRAFAGARLPLPLAHAPEFYVLESHDDAVIIQGSITALFENVHVFVIDTALPLLSHVR